MTECLFVFRGAFGIRRNQRVNLFFGQFAFAFHGFIRNGLNAFAVAGCACGGGRRGRIGTAAESAAEQHAE